nr:PqqD family protein [Kocuria subflava]
MVLQGLGPVIWESLDQPTPLDTLVDQLASHPEAPEEAEQMVRDAVAQLAERGVLLLDPANA